MKNLAKEPKTAHIDPKKGFKIHLLVFGLTVPVIWLIWLLFIAVYSLLFQSVRTH